jgi:hypothetical protein
MTGKADFTEEEWELVSEGPPSAGLIVVTAQRGGVFRETLAIPAAYVEARQLHGESQLLDELVTARPERDHTHYRSFEELKQNGLQHLRDAVLLLEQKAAAESPTRLRTRTGKGAPASAMPSRPRSRRFPRLSTPSASWALAGEKPGGGADAAISATTRSASEPTCRYATLPGEILKTLDSSSATLSLWKATRSSNGKGERDDR